MRRFKKIDWSISLTMLIACVLTVVAACVESSGPLGAPNVLYVGKVSSVQITLAQPTLALGQTTQATVVAKSSDGRVLSGPVDFSSKNPSIANVSSTGVVTAFTAGVATIQAIVANQVASAAVTVIQVPVSPVSGVLATHDFDDGTFGPYANPYPLDIDVVDDPTHSVDRRKVARLHYVKTASDVSVFDVNRAFEFLYPRKYGEPLYFRGDFLIQTADLGDGFVGRKLIYWQSHVDYAKYGASGGVKLRTVVGLHGNAMYVDATFNPQPGFGTTSDTYRTWADGIATVAGNTWYTLEVFQQLESSIGAKDGILRIWLNGQMIWEKTTMQWTDPNWLTGNVPGTSVPVDAADIYSERFHVGDQFNWAYGVWDEYRYWDNVTFSTQRMDR